MNELKKLGKVKKQIKHLIKLCISQEHKSLIKQANMDELKWWKDKEYDQFRLIND
nr:hypothetical protein [Mycoplasmopsis bovis]